MAHYAFLDENNIVTEIIVGNEEGADGVDWEKVYGEIRGQKCKRTSFNTSCGVHLKGGTPFRKNYAGTGYEYREDIDGFIPPKNFPSWILNTDKGIWEAPIPCPEDGKRYRWNEETQSWVEVTGLPF